MLKINYHYYKNNFARHYPNIKTQAFTKSTCLEIQPPRKILEDFRRLAFYSWRRSQLTVSQNAFMEADIIFMQVVRIPCLIKSIYSDRLLKSIYGGRPLEWFTSKTGGHFRRRTPYEASLCKYGRGPSKAHINPSTGLI
jgi:hypothetical protein